MRTPNCFSEVNLLGFYLQNARLMRVTLETTRILSKKSAKREVRPWVKKTSMTIWRNF